MPLYEDDFNLPSNQAGLGVAGAGGINAPSTPSSDLGIAGGGADFGQGGDAGGGGGGGPEAEPGSPEDLGIAGGAPPKVDTFLQSILSSGLPPAVIEEIIKAYNNQKGVGVPQVDVETEISDRIKGEEAKLAPPGFAQVAPTPKPFENAAMQIAQLAQSILPTFNSRQARAPLQGGMNPLEEPESEVGNLMSYLFGRRRNKARSLDYEQPEYNDPYKLLGGV